MRLNVCTQHSLQSSGSLQSTHTHTHTHTHKLESTFSQEFSQKPSACQKKSHRSLILCSISSGNPSYAETCPEMAFNIYGSRTRQSPLNNMKTTHEINTTRDRSHSTRDRQTYLCPTHTHTHTHILNAKLLVLLHVGKSADLLND